MTTEKIETPPENGIVEIETDSMVKFNTTEKVIKDAEKLLKTKVTNTKSRELAGSDRKKVNALINTVDRKRIDLKKEVVKEIEAEGQEILGRLGKVKSHLSEEIKSYDQIAKDKKAAKEKAESERLALIEDKMLSLRNFCAVPLECNITSEEIYTRTTQLESVEIDDSFQEMKSQAEMIKTSGIAAAKQALKARQEWEDQQAENERIRIENEAKAKELAEAQAKIEAEQEKARQEAERIAREAAEKQAKIEAEAKAKRDEEEAKLAAERRKIEDEKAAIQAEKDRIMEEEERKAKVELEEAQRVNDVSSHFEMVPNVVDKLINLYDHAEMRAYDDTLETFEVSNSIFQERADEFKELLALSRKRLRDAVRFEAIEENTKFEAARIEKLAAQEKRAALVEADRKALLDVASSIDKFVSDLELPEFKTTCAEELTVIFYEEMKAAINKFVKSLTELA